MNRNQEYKELIEELAVTPPELEDTLEKVLKRENTLRKRRVFGIPAGSLAACFAGFVLLVNLFPPFAAACGRIPILRELAEAVSWSPSLSAAVEHDYAQEIGLSQTENGITATVECVIVDRKQVSIFYTLDSDTVEWMDADYEIGLDRGYSSSSGSFGLENGELRQIDVTFMDMDVPPVFELSLAVYDSTPVRDTETSIAPAEETDFRFEIPVHDPEYLAEFEFTLEFDPYFTAQGEVIPVNKLFVLDGQRFLLTEVELYPTHLRINLHDDSGNTAWLKSLDLYLENEHGERFESTVNGITASGDPDGEGYATFWLDSPFFSQGEHLTLYIKRASWLDKEHPNVRLDLEHETAENLPEGFDFLGAEKHPEGWMVYFAVPREPDGGLYNLFSSGFRDEEGAQYDIMQNSSTIGIRDPKTGERREEETMFTESFPLAGFHGDIVYLEPYFNRVTEFKEAISVVIR